MWAAGILAKYDREGSQELFVKRARLTLEAVSRLDRAVWKPDELANLLAHIDKGNPERAAVVLACMDHGDKQVRFCGYRHCNDLPPEQALPRIIAGLTGDDYRVRTHSAYAFAGEYGDRSHLPLLRRELEREKYRKSERVREALQHAVKRLSE
jgi:hypothetical protein